MDVKEEWMKFETSGKITDYLSYCSKKLGAEPEKQNKKMGFEGENCETNKSHWNGDFNHACR